MVTFDFYQNSYLGSAIPENAFSGVAAQATAALARLKRTFKVESQGDEAESLAVCAMAEAIYAQKDCAPGVTAATLGSVSVRYEDAAKELSRELYRRAGIYLDIYRGVS